MKSALINFRGGSALLSSLVLGLAVDFALPTPPAAARELRVATFNILQGTGEIGSAEYNATRSVIARMDADIVCFQELYLSSFGQWTNLAAELGYPHTAINDYGSLSGGMYLGYFSRFPILSTYSVKSPTNANDLTRLPFRAVIDVPDAQRPLVLWTMHHKASSTSIDKFRRAVEAIRIVQDINGYLAANPDHVEYVLTGDMNDDIRDSQTPAQFTSQPSGAPTSYVLGTDLTFPVAYATFPSDRYATAGNGLLHVPAYWEGTTTPITRPESTRQLDYVFLSPTLMNSPLGAPQSEVYYSIMDSGGGLPKLGDPLPVGTSLAASDHLPIFVDIQMADYSSVLPVAGFASIGEAGGPFDPEYQTYTVTETNNFDTVWSVDTDVDWLSVEVDRFLLAPYESVEVDVFLNDNAAFLPPGVYTGAVLFWNETIDLLETRTATLTIRDHLAVTPPDGLAATGIAGGPFDPASQTYVVTNKSAFSIPFTAKATENWLTVSPASWTLNAGEAVEVTVGLNAEANLLAIGTYADTVVFSNQTTGLVQERPASLAVVGELCNAVDRCALAWTTGGNSDWIYQTDISSDGEDAAQSGPLSASQQTWMETVVAGPVRVNFQWKVSSRSTHYLRFYVDESLVASLSGETDWTNRTHELAAGVHTLRWVFTNSTTAPVGANAGWVDQVALDYLTATPTTTWYASGTPGGPFSPATRQYILTNSGPDTLQWSAIPSVAWISASPVGGDLEPGGGATVELSLNENASSLAAGTYPGAVVFSNQTTGVSFLRQASLTIQDYLVITPSYSWHTGYVGGPYSPPVQTYALSNSGPMAISWSATRNTNWVTLEPTSGIIGPGAVSNLAVSLNSNANVLVAGWHYAQLTFSNATTQLSQTRWVYLELDAALSVGGTVWLPTGPVGGPFEPASAVYTLTNQSAVPQNWRASASAAWLTLGATNGALAGNTSTQITASLNANATALPMGAYSAAVVISNPATGDILSQSVALSVGVVFCDAIEACQQEWTFGGDAPWLYQTNTMKDGLDAATSDTIADSQETWIQTAVTGPGSLTFWWKVSSEASYDYLEFWLDGLRTNRISGAVDWERKTYVLGSGAHVLRWRYMKDSVYSSGSDRGWVDLVSWIPARTAMGVPIAWYERYGRAPAEDETWDDLDWLPAATGAPNWVQHVAGLDPTDPASIFQILDIQQDLGEPVRIEWWGGTNGPTSPYVIESTRDPESGPWDPIGFSPRAAGLNTWTNAEPAGDLRFYRILAPPDPAP